jgi:hypothetical protein
MPVSPYRIKMLPRLPVINETAEAPPPLQERQLLEDIRKTEAVREQKRPLSWAEEQINMLQRENKDLRQFIINQKRLDAEKDEDLVFLKRQNAEYLREIDRQTNMVAQFVNTLNVAVQDFHETRAYTAKTNKHRDVTSTQSSDELSDIIRIYGDTLL